MKISVFITTILVAQVSASFFDVFHGAVLSVQNSFGKLLSDVVTDVKETVDCTILAVEHVLSLSHDATTRYYDKCGSVTSKTDSVSETLQNASAPKVEVTLNLPNNSEYLQKIPAEIDARINETLSKVLGNYKSHDNVLSIENVLAKESEQLASVSVLVKKELDKLSREVTTDLKKIETQRESQPSVDTILQEIRVLEKREHNTKNTSEARVIHQVIDQVLGKLDAIEATEANENIKLEEILKDLESNSNNSFVGLRQQFQKWKEEESRHLSEIKSKIDEHEKISEHLGSFNRHRSNHPQPVKLNIDMNKDVEPIINSQEIFNDNTTQAKEKLYNNTNSRTTEDINDKLLMSVSNGRSSSQTGVNESGWNDTVITSNSYSTENPFESPTTVGSSALATLYTTPPNNLTRKNTNETVTNTTLDINNSAPVDENISKVDLLAGLDKQGSTSISEPTTILSTNENNSNETMTVSNPLQPSEIEAIKYAILPVITNGDSEKSSESAKNNDTFIISAAETVETEMTSTFKSHNNTNDTMISSTVNTMVENTFGNATSSENEESSTSPTNELVTTFVTIDVIASNDTMLTRTSPSINFTTPLNVTILPIESSTATDNEEFSTGTAQIISDNDSNNTMLISEPIRAEETTSASSRDQSTTESCDTKISTTALLTVENTPVSVTIQTIKTDTTSDSEKSSTVTTTLANDNDSNNTMISTVSSPIEENESISGTIKPEETTTVFATETLSNDSNETMITSISLPSIDGTFKNNIMKPDETNSTTSLIVNENYSDTTITSTPTPIISTAESETIEALDTATVSTRDEESLGSTVNSPTGPPITADDDDDDDSSAAVVTMTPETISESVFQENVTATVNDEHLASTTNSPIIYPTASIDPDSTTDAIYSTAFSSSEITTVSEIIEPVESTDPMENLEPSVSTTTPVTIPDENTNKKTDTFDTVTSTTENADSAAVTEITQSDKISTAYEEQELSSTSTTTESAIIVTTSTVIPPTESTASSESITTFRNEEDLENSPTLEANTSTTPDSPDLNFRVRTPPPTITENAPVNREWLTLNTPKQQNYNTNEPPRNIYEFNAPISLSDRLLQTREPLINPEVPMYGQPVPPITRSLFNGAAELLTPDRLFPKSPNQQPKIENVALQQAAFDFFDSADERLSHSGSSVVPEDDILKTANIPSTPLITNASNISIDPQRMNYEIPSSVPTPEYPIGPPYSFGDRVTTSTYSPQGLTTHRPKKTSARAKNYKSPPMDYDSFFHTPPRDSEAHQRALKEARQLMANSKRSERIIHSIMKNRNKFNARSVLR